MSGSRPVRTGRRCWRGGGRRLRLLVLPRDQTPRCTRMIHAARMPAMVGRRSVVGHGGALRADPEDRPRPRERPSGAGAAGRL